MPLTLKKKTLGTGSLCLSLTLHLLAFYWVQCHVFFAHSSLDKTILSSEWLAAHKIDKNQVLQQTFETFKKPSSQQTISKVLPSLPIHPPVPNAPRRLAASKEATPPPEFASIQHHKTLPTHLSFCIDLPSLLPSLEIPPSPPPQNTEPFTPISYEFNLELECPPPHLPIATPPPPAPVSSISLLSSDSLFVESSPCTPPLSINSSSLLSLKDFKTASFAESFDAEIVFSPFNNEYIFAITLIPHPHLQLPKIQQNYTFLIDRSNTIQKDRLNTTKTAILKALEELYPEDTFNLIAFDSKIEKLSSTPLPYTPESLKKAKAFLDRMELGSFFSHPDLLSPLVLTVPSEDPQDQIQIAIALTNGEGLSRKNVQCTLLKQWTQYNQGKVSFFAVGIDGDPHIGTLDAICAYNRGKLVHSPSERGIKRKLPRLVKSISLPIAKNLRCVPIAQEKGQSIELACEGSLLPHLYFDQPYTILGKTNSLEDFFLFFQGDSHGEGFHIKKRISFLQARKAARSLKGEWALQGAYRLYSQYLCDADPQHLTEAKELLEPYHIPLALQ